MRAVPQQSTGGACRPKVFGIGFHKTGTTSLAVALYTLGYDVCGYFGNDDPDIAETAVDRAFALADRYDAAQDMPWPVLFRELDRRYPGSRFILTLRPEAAWIDSVVKHFKGHRIRSHEWIYGVPTARGNEGVYLERYRRHNADVLAYFADRPSDLLVMELGQGDGWDELCPFLEQPIPDIPFPIQNTAAAKNREVGSRLLRAARSRGRQAVGPLGVIARREHSMTQTVSADLARSMVHRHYQRFDDAIAVAIAVQLAGEAPCDRWLLASIARICSDQLAEELDVMAQLGAPVGRWTPVPGDLALTVERWHQLRIAMRAHLARIDDRAISARTTDGRPVWQVVLDLVDRGAERHARLRVAIEHSGRELPRRPLFQPVRAGRLQRLGRTQLRRWSS